MNSLSAMAIKHRDTTTREPGQGMSWLKQEMFGSLASFMEKIQSYQVKRGSEMSTKESLFLMNCHNTFQYR